MTSIADLERDTYDAMWELPQYQGEPSPGAQFAPLFSTIALPRSTVLDAGCGNGKGALTLASQGFSVYTCDISSAGLPPIWPLPFFQAAVWDDLTGWNDGTYDWVYCCNVLEHLPPQFTMLAVSQMLRIATHGVFLTVSTQPDGLGIWIGKSLRPTVQGFTWWRDSLRELSIVFEARDLVGAAVFVLEGRAT